MALRLAAMLVGLVLGLAVGAAVLAAVGIVIAHRMDPRRELEALARNGLEARRHGWFRRSARRADRRVIRVLD